MRQGKRPTTRKTAQYDRRTASSRISTTGHPERALAWVERPRLLALMQHLTGRRPMVRWSVLLKEAADRNAIGGIAERDVTRVPYALPGVPGALRDADPRAPEVALRCPSVTRRLAQATTAALLAGDLSPEVRQHFLSSLVAYPAILHWRAQSRRVLQVHRQLVEDLANGEAPTITGEDLELPFSALYVELPRGITMVDPLDSRRRLTVDGALVTCDAESADTYARRTLRMYVIGKVPRRWPARIEPIIPLSLPLDHRLLREARVGPEEARQRIHLPRDFAPYAGMRAVDPARELPLPPAAANDFGMFMVALLHDLTHRPDRKEDKRRAAAIARNRNGQRAASKGKQATSYYFAGHGHATSASAGGWREGKPLAFQVYVRRHIRNQACGPKLGERKRIWIKAHKRGATHGGVRTTRSRVRPRGEIRRR